MCHQCENIEKEPASNENLEPTKENYEFYGPTHKNLISDWCGAIYCKECERSEFDFYMPCDKEVE